jgi:hypothetical protein
MDQHGRPWTTPPIKAPFNRRFALEDGFQWTSMDNTSADSLSVTAEEPRHRKMAGVFYERSGLDARLKCASQMSRNI